MDHIDYLVTDEDEKHCYYHSRKIARHCCEECRKAICDSCAIVVEGRPYCQICWERYTLDFKKQHESETSRLIPWQRRGEIGAVRAFMETAGQVVFQPVIFFSHLPASRDLKTPLMFALICVIFIWFPLYLFHLKIIFPPLLDYYVAMATNPDMTNLDDEFGRQSAEMTQELRNHFQSISPLDILIMPLVFISWYIILASVLQQALIQFFRGREGFAATLEIRCYAMILQSLWLIPIVGVVLAEILSILICTRGFQVVQKLSFTQALFVATIPAFVLMLI